MPTIISCKQCGSVTQVTKTDEMTYVGFCPTCRVSTVKIVKKQQTDTYTPFGGFSQTSYQIDDFAPSGMHHSSHYSSRKPDPKCSTCGRRCSGNSRDCMRQAQCSECFNHHEVPSNCIHHEHQMKKTWSTQQPQQVHFQTTYFMPNASPFGGPPPRFGGFF